ncbi:MAG: 2-amino-4-hydroxy-6-hydroxymethyldihydropteridine diphosphokinase [Kiritimatiellia bacterium]
MEIGLSLGSNLGDRLQNLKAAKKLILASGNAAFIAQSPVYETEPVDVPAADRDMPFLNAVLVVASETAVKDLQNIFRRIELEIGRVPDAARNSRRPIDIDIIYAGDLRVDEEGITIPHPRWFQRRFVLQPLCDLHPDLVIPGQASAVQDVLRNLPDRHKVKMAFPVSAW